MKKYLFILMLMLAGCATTPPAITTNVCTIPADLSIKGSKLPQIKLTPYKNGNIPIKPLIKQWGKDIKQYNDLLANNDALIDWVEKYCVTTTTLNAHKPDLLNTVAPHG